ncbi:CDP-glycerol glycerophosphotransferase family protein, partial [Streptococcus pseudopneumoniae]|uniref:CDP-glycerol glycerophosphotransferase family protein n=1 Tax=Streptococcus pseudopneumoniae TaxID=257758 RepID=UPI00110C25AF
EKFNAAEIKKNLEIPKEKKIILFANQTLPLLEEKQLITSKVFEVMKNFEDCHLLIRPHPNEINLDFYHKLISTSKISNYSIAKNENLYKLLFISDIVIVPFSTVGFEAMRLEKPVIALNLLNLHNDDPLIKSNTSIVVNDSTNLLSAIKKCLEKNEIKPSIENGKIYSEKLLGS